MHAHAYDHAETCGTRMLHLACMPNVASRTSMDTTRGATGMRYEDCAGREIAFAQTANSMYHACMPPDIACTNRLHDAEYIL